MMSNVCREIHLVPVARPIVFHFVRKFHSNDKGGLVLHLSQDHSLYHGNILPDAEMDVGSNRIGSGTADLLSDPNVVHETYSRRGGQIL